MLKRPRPSSPARPDPSSPPPLENASHFPIAKRRRTAGPVIDSMQRRDSSSVDDGEDDYGDDDDEDAGGTSVYDGPQGKDYEHVNHFLHGLHAEQQHRSRLQPQPSFAQPQPQYHGAQASFFSHRGNLSPPSSPASSPAKFGMEAHMHRPSILSTSYRDHVGSQESEDYSQVPDRVDVDGGHKGPRSGMQDEERLHVMHRYEDTNRLLGSLVLSRRRTLVSPSLDSE